ncbi:MAG: DUF2959 domain-containing protein [Thermoanaerobaculia bacterium]|nr:DUF2959 domain-containing protein [Thermoanaerobaculia bacterium]
MTIRALRPPLLVLVLFALALAGCKAAREKYYGALEKVGIEKRELLVHRVDKAKEAQQDAQEQFKDALEEFQALVGHQGGDLEAMYKKLSGEYEASVRRADEVRERVRKVEEVAQSLFDEWRAEIGQYGDASLRRESERQLEATRARYGQLVQVMKRSTQPMEPVLGKLHDQVLFLKHNLNARALGSLSGTAKTLQADVDALVAQMQTSIAEADRFIAEMKATK